MGSLSCPSTEAGGKNPLLIYADICSPSKSSLGNAVLSPGQFPIHLN